MGNSEAEEFQTAPLMITVASLLLVWQCADYLLDLSPLIFPSPLEVVRAAIEHPMPLLTNTAITFAEATCGFVLAILFGVASSFVVVFFPKSKNIIMPLAVALKATPVLVLAPMFVIWFGNGYLSKIALSGLASFFPILVSTCLGLTSLEPEWISLMKLHRATDWQIFLYLRLPKALPSFFAGARVAWSLAVVGAIVAEFSGAEAGLGRLIATSSYYLNMDMVFAAVFLLSAMGICGYWAIASVHRKVVFWEHEV